MIVWHTSIYCLFIFLFLLFNQYPAMQTLNNIILTLSAFVGVYVGSVLHKCISHVQYFFQASDTRWGIKKRLAIVTCYFDLCDGSVSALCVCPDLHYIDSLFGPRQLYKLFVGGVQSSRGVSLLPDQHLRGQKNKNKKLHIIPMCE